MPPVGPSSSQHELEGGARSAPNLLYCSSPLPELVSWRQDPRGGEAGGHVSRRQAPKGEMSLVIFWWILARCKLAANYGYSIVTCIVGVQYCSLQVSVQSVCQYINILQYVIISVCHYSNISILEDLGTTRPSFQLLQRAGGPSGPLGPCGPCWGPVAPSRVAISKL